MHKQRHLRSFWEARVTELARGHSLESIASEHDVLPKRLRWWRWKLGTQRGLTKTPARMLEVVRRPPATGLRMVAGDVVLEIPLETSPEYVGRILGAVRATC
jgi:hypothetical protein